MSSSSSSRSSSGASGPLAGTLPTFLIIGAQKSATRWLRYNLGLHPDVFTASRELMFFNYVRRYDELGVEWYRQQFAGRHGEPIVGEATPGYMMLRHRPAVVSDRIRTVLPDVKLIAVLRNPIDRAQSAMLHHIRRDRLPRHSRLVDVVTATPPKQEWLGLVTGGLYAASLRPYCEVFGNRLQVLLHDDIGRDPKSVYDAALVHVGAEPGFVPAGLDEVIFSNRGRSKLGGTELTIDDREVLWEYFRDDVARLEEMLNRDLSIWRPSVRVPRVVRDHYERAAAWVADIVRGIAPEQWNDPTPCDRWTVGELVEHLLDGTRGFAVSFGAPRASALADAGGVDTPNAAADAYRDAAAAISAAARQATSTGEQTPDGWYVGFALLEQVAHGWDLAVATGQDATIPDELAPFALDVARGAFDTLLRSRPGYGPEVSVRRNASAGERFVALTGRRPTTLHPV